MSLGVLHSLVREVCRAFLALRDALADEDAFVGLLYELGWDVESLPQGFAALGSELEELLAQLEGLADDPAPTELLALLGRVSSLYGQLKELADLPDGVDADAFRAEFPPRLFEWLAVEYLRHRRPATLATLEALGIVELQFIDAQGGRPAYARRSFSSARLARLIGDPSSIPSELYRWGQSDFGFQSVVEAVHGLASAAQFAAGLGESAESIAQAYGSDTPLPEVRVPLLSAFVDDDWHDLTLTLLGLPPAGGRPPGLAVQFEVPGAIDARLDIDDDWKLALRGGGGTDTAFGLRLAPGTAELVQPFDAGLPAGGFGFTLERRGAEPMVLLGRPSGTRVELRGFALSFDLEGDGDQLEARLRLAPDDLKVVLTTGELDSFLGGLLGGEKKLDLPLAIEWSNRRGLSFSASPGFELEAHPHLRLGPISIETLCLALRAGSADDGSGDLGVEALVTLGGELGPVGFSIQEMGVELQLEFGSGNAGPFGISADFRPPAGMGISLNAPPIVGGGFLYLDHERGRYAGIVHVEVFEIGVTAIGLLDTKVPGVDYSFLILISATFPPIQLSFGFDLRGIGGLAGIHRTIVTEALQSGMRSGSVDHILFPDDPIQNAPAILATLQSVFPPEKDRYTFGLAFMMGWSGLVEIQLGLVIEVPSPVRLVLLGQLRMGLPSPDLAIALIQVDVLGIVDFERQLVSVDAILRDSHLAGFPLTGEMAFRLVGGDQPAFALSVGGVHPHFPVRILPPDLARVGIQATLGDIAEVSFQGYEALTSNSYQIGARVSVVARAGGFELRGWAGYDAVIQLVPLWFRADFDAGVSISKGGTKLAAIQLEAALSGPAPFRISGKACLSLLFFDVCVPVEIEFGPSKSVELESKDPWPPLQAALEKADNWESVRPGGVTWAVAYAGPPDAAEDSPPLLPPDARLVSRTSVLPFGRTLERFGHFAPENGDRFDLVSVKANGRSLAFEVVKDHYPPDWCEALSEAEKVSRASFELMDLGFSIDLVDHGEARARVAEYETQVVDSPWSSHSGPNVRLEREMQRALDMHAAAARSEARTGNLAEFAPGPEAVPAVGLDEAAYVVASTSDLSAQTDVCAPTTAGAAALALEEFLNEHPEQQGELQVLATFEARMPS